MLFCSFLSTNLLHSNRVIEQVPITRRLITRAIAQQYYGCYLLPQLWYSITACILCANCVHCIYVYAAAIVCSTLLFYNNNTQYTLL